MSSNLMSSKLLNQLRGSRFSCGCDRGWLINYSGWWGQGEGPVGWSGGWVSGSYGIKDNSASN